MHHFFYSYPYLTTCPFHQSRAAFRKMMHI
jgi:hypothetical protein